MHNATMNSISTHCGMQEHLHMDLLKRRGKFKLQKRGAEHKCTVANNMYCVLVRDLTKGQVKPTSRNHNTPLVP